MDAMLALAGSHLAVQVENPMTSLALSHRQNAITGLEAAFAKWPPSASEAHVMLATSYLLSNQSSYMFDGFLEHIVSLRGCALLTQLILKEGLAGPFTVSPSMHSKVMDKAFGRFPQLDQRLACGALFSLKRFAERVSESDVQPIIKALITQFVATIRPLLTSNKTPNEDAPTRPSFTESVLLSNVNTACTTPYGPLAVLNPLFPIDLAQAFSDIDWANLTTPPSSAPNPIHSFNALMSTLTILATWPYDALTHVFDPTNQFGNIVLAHFCAIRFIVSPLSVPETAMRTPVKAVVEWAERIVEAVRADKDEEWMRYVEWPVTVLRCMQESVERKRGLTFGDVKGILLGDPEAFVEGRAGRF